MGRLDGRIALITGAGRGQGAAIARSFAVEGARVLVSDVMAEQAAAVADELGSSAASVGLDVGSAAGWSAAVDHALARFGGLDILVNNAGIFPRAMIEEQTEDQYMNVVRVNQLGCWLGMKAVIAPMREAGRGGIVNTASAAGLIGMVGMSAYVASKHAVRGMSKTAAAELGQYGIRVNTIFPGTIYGELMQRRGVDTAKADELMADRPIRRVGRVEDIANAALFLASDESAYCTGAELLVDGGALASPWQFRTVPAKAGD